VVAWALRRSGGRVQEAARLLGVHRNTITALKPVVMDGVRVRSSRSG
jgi:hypothetical protein